MDKKYILPHFWWNQKWLKKSFLLLVHFETKKMLTLFFLNVSEWTENIFFEISIKNDAKNFFSSKIDQPTHSLYMTPGSLFGEKTFIASFLILISKKYFQYILTFKKKRVKIFYQAFQMKTSLKMTPKKFFPRKVPCRVPPSIVTFWRKNLFLCDLIIKD